MRIALALVALLTLAAPAAAQVTTPAEMLRSTLTNFIRPQVKGFAAKAEALSAGMDGLCEAPSPATLDGARRAFAEAVTAYGRIEFMRIGPLMEDNRVDRILFWPDRRGIGLRQVQQVLAEADPTATTVAGLAAKSVAVQGLGALEFVLFGTGSDGLAAPGEDFRCLYGGAIAQNVADMAQDIATAWDDPNGIGQRLTQPVAENVDFRTTTESLEAVVGLVSHGVEALRDTRINPVLPKDGKAGAPKQALFWRSGLTLAMLRANIESMQTLILLSGIVSDPDLAVAVDAAFARALTDLDAIPGAIETALADPEQIAALADLVAATQSLQQLIGEELSSTLGLSVGFSSMDGD